MEANNMTEQQKNSDGEVKKTTIRHYITANGEIHEAKHYYYSKYDRRGRPKMDNKKKLRSLLKHINDENCAKILEYIKQNELIDRVSE